MSDLSRVEQLLRNALGEDIYNVTPQSRVEILLAQLNELIEGMGGGSVSPEDIATAVAAYLDEHLTNPTSPPVDTSLAIAGAAADAKKTGDEISELKEDLSQIVDIDYLYRNAFSITKYVSAGASTNQNAAITDKMPVQGGDVLHITYNITATQNPSIFSSIFLQLIEYDANDAVIKRTFKYDAPLTLMTNTTKISFNVTYSCSNTGGGYNEVFDGFLNARIGDITLNPDIHIESVDMLMGIVGTDGQTW